MIELLIGFGVASWMGIGGLYAGLLIFAFVFPRLFRIFYWLLMMPIMTLGSASFLWLFSGFFFGWSSQSFSLCLAIGGTFGFLFCLWTDPRQMKE
jgi:hypothetical protein